MENFEFSLSALKSLVPESEKSCSTSELGRLLSRPIWTSQDRQYILGALAQLLLDKEYTSLIGRQLRPLLLDLLQRNADAIKAGNQINHDLHERHCVAMSKLIGSHPDVLPFALRYFQVSSPVFQRLFLESSDSSTIRYGRRRMKLRDLMEAAYRFLQHEPSLLRELWDWSVCLPLLRSHDTAVRWYTANCLAVVTSMNDEHRLTFLKKILSPDEIIYFKLKLLEEVHAQNIEKSLVLANPDITLWHRRKSLPHKQDQIVSEDLCSSVVAVCGVVLPKQQLKPKDEESISHLILVESTCKNLQRLAMAVSFQNAVLLEGPIGCGKTALVEYLAAVTGRVRPPDILKVQLGDQTDSKTLLGMYRCTDIPGEFVWQPGTLTQAVTSGQWILLEDIDYAPLDVISVLIPLLENGELLIPGWGDCIKVAPGFQFFATRRLLSSSTGWYRQQNAYATLLDKYWVKIQLDNMTKAELKEVLVKRYPSLKVTSDRLLEIYIQLTGDKHQRQNGDTVGREQAADTMLEQIKEEKAPTLEGRGLSLRDLLKWCNRIVHNFDSSSPDTALNVFQEALDCFTAMLPKQGSRLKMAEAIGSKLNISKEKTEYYCLLYKPAITIGELEVTVGRVEVLRKQTETLLIQREKQTFAATRPSSLLLEQLALCINRGEPVLLVGETGTGKTSAVQYLAKVTGHRLRVVNMNQQSDTADLLGGYKPVDHRLIWLPLREGFEELFIQTFSQKQNAKFLGHIQTCYRHKRWHVLLKLMQHIHKVAIGKERQTSHMGSLLKEKWEAFGLRLNHAQQQMKMTENALVFAFVEGTLTQAVKKGEWILLDEINLAAAETLECLSGLLEGCCGSLVLLDRGDTEPLMRHPDFRLFACMNPATDVGKKNLPPGIRNRFTELYVEELENEGDLQILIMDYLRGLNVNKNTSQGIISFYLSIRKEASTKLVDGTGNRPHYSLRTLCRALRYAASNPCKSIQRSLYEGFCLGFLTQLDRVSHPIVQKLICQHIVSCNVKNLLKQSLPEPQGGQFIEIEGYWIPLGSKDPVTDETYILTASVKLNLRDLVRVVSAGTYPVLIQGETSVGKTSLIRWLAAATGNHCVRINNHEHTDVQEYIGCYTSDASGKLVFREGILIDAMRKGYWVILDELNLAPTDVLEALNRLLDDNRELFITETQEVVKAHPHFMLFATQNPPGMYGGRKVLSRAFRNRFVELHYDELPSAELEIILHKRCSLPPSYCNKLVKVMLDLQSCRRGSTVFAGKHGFITLRDLFRWAERYRLTEQTEKDYDWLQHLVNDGFILLAGRVRKQEEVLIIQGVLEKHFKRKLNPESLFSEDSMRKQLSMFPTQSAVQDCEFSHVVWTRGMRRLAVLVGRALEFGEPVLLVGDTGCGKTTICQVFAALANQDLYSVNCHLHMETSDFLGGLRPIRQRSSDEDASDNSRLFEWHDGPLVLAMKEDGFFLLDEISLADDSVLERLNSVLEVEKTLVLAEKGSPEEEGQKVELLTAGKKFHILATMNPGGDFGKKELSPALRNRFTEIWCPQSSCRGELIEIIQHNLRPGLSFDATDHKGEDIAELMMDFIEWLLNQEFGCRCILSIRDILSWVNFMNVMAEDEVEEEDEEMDGHCKTPFCTMTTFVHAACLVYIDGIGSGATSCSADATFLARKACLSFLSERLSKIVRFTKEIQDDLRIYDPTKERKLVQLENWFGIHPFYIPRGLVFEKNNLMDYTFSAGTTAMNAQRLLRALKLNKPILMEGSPGVGKTSLVAALAKASGNHLIRINLSEQTDITDLFGTDLPVEGGRGGEFAWRDGPLLAALKAGHWIVLDELNLASQSVLEGLNACFDHRAEVCIPELGMTFQVQHEKTKIFGCQNPYRQGGGRKGLPRSFLNRFTQVYVDQLSLSDMEFIANTMFPAIGKSTIAKMVAFNNKIDQEVMVERSWGQKGGPWEFNLRDLFRWCQLILTDQSPGCYDPGQHVFLVYGERMRTKADSEKLLSVFREVFGLHSNPYVGTLQFHITPYNVQIGYSVLTRGTCVPPLSHGQLALLHNSLQSLESVMKCVQMGWMVILVGPATVGKSSLIQLLALLTGHRLKIMTMNSAMDTTELLGGFEQVDINRPWRCFLEKVESTVQALLRDSLLATDVSVEETEVLLRAWSTFSLTCKSDAPGEGARSIAPELVNKLERVLALIQRQNNKTNTFSKAENSSLVEDFCCFRRQLLQTVEGRSHGAFEWVDGMLVQALQSGDWLLMDNVNFCSSSVLDRLNALLEPGGSLVMSERGVIDGCIPTVVPHPNFRLFLSMDPLHGEISRAMRNRGIEIYISGEGDGNALDQWDIKLLLHGLGLMGEGVCDALLAIHTEAKDILAGTSSSISALVHAATLISQRLKRGLCLVEAFHGACLEVYACCQHSQTIQKHIQEVIARHLSALGSSETWDCSLLGMGLWPDCMPSAMFTAEDSTLSTVLRDGQILVYCLNRLNLKNSRSLPLVLQDLQKVMQSTNAENLQFSATETCASWLEESDAISAAVKLVTERSTNQDWTLRVRWLHQLAKNVPPVLDSVHIRLDAGAEALNSFYTSTLSSGISRVVKLLQPNITDEHVIPLDPRWNMQSLDIMRNSMSFDTEVEHAEQLLMLLYSVANRVLLFLNRKERAHIEKNTSYRSKWLSRTSALRMSAEFHKDPEHTNSLPHPVVAHLAAFFELWDSSVLHCVQSNQTALTDDDTNEIMCRLLWRDRFWNIADTVTVDPSGLALLSLHWHWIMKHHVDTVPQLLTDHEQHKASQDIQVVSQHIQSSLTSPTELCSRVKNLQKMLGRPLPYKDEVVVQCAIQLNVLSGALQVVELRPVLEASTWHWDICRLRAAALGWRIKRDILYARGLVLQANHSEKFETGELKHSVDFQCSHLKAEGVLSCHPVESHSKDVPGSKPDPTTLIQLSSRIQLWPALEYLSLLWQYKLTTDIIAHMCSQWKNGCGKLNLRSELSQHVAFCLKWTSAPSQQLQGLWYLLQFHELSFEEFSSLWSELVNSALASFWSSTVTTDVEYWSSWKPVLATKERKMKKFHIDSSVKGPGILSRAVFSKCFFEVLTSSNRTVQWDVTGLPVLLSSHVTLGEWIERTKQLENISTILWSNMTHSSKAEFRSTDSRLQGLLLCQQLMTLKELVPGSLQDEYVEYCDSLRSRNPAACQYVRKMLMEETVQGKLPEDILGLILTCLQQYSGNGEETESLSEPARRGCLWVNLGLLQIQVWLPQTMFDPAVKREHKLKYAKEELQELENEWKMRNLFSQLHTGRDLDDETVLKYSHPHSRLLLERMQQSRKQISSLLKKQTYRPHSPSYDRLYQEIHYYVTSIAKVSVVQDLLFRLLQVLQGEGPESRHGIQNLLSEEAAWQLSHHHFRKRLAEEYALYPDVVTPLQAAILQMQHGMRLVASEVYTALSNSFVSPSKLAKLVTSLLSFPSVGFSFPTYLAHADTLCSVSSVDVLRGLRKLSLKYPGGNGDECREPWSCPTQEQLLVSALLYLRSHVLSKGELDQKSLKLFRHICQAIINEWDEQERHIREREQQDSSLYKHRNKKHGSGLNEEEEEEIEFRSRFPLYEKDFADIKAQPTLEEKMEITADIQEDLARAEPTRISHSSMQTLILIHQQICLSSARSLWYQQNSPSHQTKHYLTAFLSCYQISAVLITHFYPLIGAKLNDCLLGSQLLASTLLQNTVSGEVASDIVLQHDTPYDFYQHPNIQEVIQCQPVLKNLTNEVNRLLKEWPDHPALLQLLVVMDRIRSFPLSSPLAKFLNGLEILLAKSQDWEEQASRTLSLRKHLNTVTKLIIQWRKLELNCWSLSLDNAVKRHTEKSTKHWFSIYQLIEKYLQEQTVGQMEGGDRTETWTLSSLITTLQTFIEGSTLGEFHIRLRVLLVFHCHVLLVPQVERKASLCSVLWNLYNYYKQFSERVQTRINELRCPLEKELKDFVNISRWNDASFWSMKQSVERTHRTLFKYMKKFEAALCEPCLSSLVESTGEQQQLDCMAGQEAADVVHSSVQRLKIVLRETLNIRMDSVQVDPSAESPAVVMLPLTSLQRRLPKLTKRMKTVCSAFMEKSLLLDLLEGLDLFTGDIIVTAHELQNLAVDQTLNKDRQKSEVKHILVQKQRALSDLFKTLTKTGLSYRKGLVWSRSKDPQDVLYLHPLNLRSALALVNSAPESDSILHIELSSTWDGCEKYFYRSLARHARLKAAFSTPAKEIGLGNIERCKGFTAHLLKLLVKQRKSLTTLTERWIIVRNLLSCVQEIHFQLNVSREYNVAFPPQDGLQQWVDRLQHLSMQCIMVLEQLSWFLQCCPSELAASCDNSTKAERKSGHARGTGAERSPAFLQERPMPELLLSETNCSSPVLSNQLPIGCTMRKKDQVWQRETIRITEMLNELRVKKAEVDQIKRQASETLFYSWKAFEVCSSGFCVLVKVSAQLQDTGLLFTEAEGQVESPQTAVAESIDYMQEEVSKTAADFTVWKTQLLCVKPARGTQESDEGYVDDFSEQVDVAIRAVLCAIQDLVEKRNNKETQATSTEETDDVQEEALAGKLHSGHLTKLLAEDLSTELNCLRVQKIISAVSELVERLKSYGEDCLAEKHKIFNQSCCFLIRLMPMLSTYLDLLLYYLTVSLAAHRSTGKLLSILAQIFTELALKGFCLPMELLEEAAREGATQFHDYEGGGIGEGEGMKDVSDKIENEEQVEDTHQKDQEKENEEQDSKPDVKEEDNAVEMSEDFDGKMHDIEHDKKGEDDEDEESESEDEELDKQMGDLGDGKADNLNERLWGDENEEDDKDHDDTQDSGPGMDEGEDELVAKDDNMDARRKNKEDKKQHGKDEVQEELENDSDNKEKIHEQMDEREYNENEIDPFHGNEGEQPAPEDFNLPEDLNLENKKEEEMSDIGDSEGEEQNPYEIEEKPVELDTADSGENHGEDEGSEEEKAKDREPEQAEEGATKNGTDGEADAEQQDADQEETAENPKENDEEQQQQADREEQKSSVEDEEKGTPADQGLQPQDEERGEKPEENEELPECTERMEHESCGQTGEDNLQSESAVELGGAASEKDDAKEEHGSGTADAHQAEGHESKQMARLASQRRSTRKTKSFKRKPGQADDERTLGNSSERVHKRLRMVDSSADTEQNLGQLQQKVEEADAYEHVKEGAKSYDAQTYDAANKEQQKATKQLSEGEEKNEDDAEDGAMEIEEMKEEQLETVTVDELKPENIKATVSKMKGSDKTELEIQAIKSEDDNDARREQSTQESEDEKPERSKESTIHTAHQFLMDLTIQKTIFDAEELRRELEQQLEAWQAQLPGSSGEEKAAAEMWQQYLSLTAPLSQQLCEQLRLILEPTQAAKLKGDYRTGKRLNMRKVIPYIASQFRKDKIWLRRTKPSKRQYQICLAIDDSSSMIDNHSKQLAFESLAVIGNALTLLEVGQIAVYSFGESVQLLHPFHEQFSDQSGSRILRLCKFQQKKTHIAQFLESSASMFAAAQLMSQSSNPETAQLLLIVSDGRGIFLEGKERVTAAVQAAQNANIFVIFVVLDNPNSRDSIFDIKVPIFGGPGEMPEIRSYMDEFPFPFYIVLRDVNALPETLSDALRQWFELVTASDHQ
ncbi:midasin [Microcaecilia unicolor]|uniref:Midasin n=1 Tax=Microcaecilia unicolor TaxID=1415580 RepID=A0A6P7XR14_9AMPH|nr:midasin [Microcaecilia unicolor]